MTIKTYELRLRLKAQKLPVWRRFLVKSDVLLSDLSNIVLTVMGWTEEAPYYFFKDDKKYLKKTEEDVFWDTIHNIDVYTIRLYNVLKKKEEVIDFHYLHESEWVHEIQLKAISPLKFDDFYPKVIDGNMACPGQFVRTIQEYKDIMRAFERKAQRENLSINDELFFFDVKTTNALLKLRNFGQLRFQ